MISPGLPRERLVLRIFHELLWTLTIDSILEIATMLDQFLELQVYPKVWLSPSTPIPESPEDGPNV